MTRTTRRRIGLLTIGGAPRPDNLVREVQAVMGPSVEVVERGALDGLSPEQVAALSPNSHPPMPLVTQMADGRSVTVDSSSIIPLLGQRVLQLERDDQVEATLLLCTGSFPQVEHERTLFQPHTALYRAVAGIAGSGRLAALTPIEAQAAEERADWSDAGVGPVDLLVADPYSRQPVAAVERAAGAARDAGAQLLYLDCFGYDCEMKEVARDAFGGPVVLARSLAARLFAELVA